MRALIIGGTGSIGPWVVRGLCEAGCEVTVFRRGEHTAQLPAEVREILHPVAARNCRGIVGNGSIHGLRRPQIAH